MSQSDIVLMVMGIALILAGSVLFITGKQAGGKNKIEALGIKMDVSNPSLVLIIFGILLLLTPRLMPDNGQDNGSRDERQKTNDQSSGAERDASTISQQPVPVVKNTVKPKIKSHPEIQGNYKLTSYIEDGVTINSDGQLTISAGNNGNYPFSGDLQAYIDWATTVNFHYEGYLAHRGNKWFLKIDTATDPEWVDRGEVGLTLIKDGGSISMKYYYDAQISVRWER